MEENKRTSPNRLKKKIDQGIRRTGFDENFINAVKFHLEVIYSKIEASNIKSQYDYCNLLMSKLFVDKIDLYPTKKFKCQVNECSGWPLPLLPSEVFGETKLPVEGRKNMFYKCLQVGDVLDCRVAKVLPTEYHLRVIHKYGTTRILDDLNITVVMPRNESEQLILKKELFECELVRVLVSEINKEDEVKIYVAVSGNIGGMRQYEPQLGRISEEHLPTYVLDPPEMSSTYSFYLRNLPSFRNSILLNNIFEGFGIEPRGVYTFYPICESVKPVDGKILLKESQLSDVKHFTDLALQQLENENVEKALSFIQKAIELYPMKSQTKSDKDELSKLYEIRGTITDLALQELENENAEKALSFIQKAIEIYPVKNQTESDKVELSKLYEIRARIRTKMEKLKISNSTVLDLELTYKADRNNQCGRKHLSRIMFIASKKYYKIKEYKKAAEVAENAIKLNKYNVEALAIFEYLKSKHSEVFVNLDNESLLSLQEKKKELVTELKKIIT